jgi:thioredoxin 1
MTNKAMELSVNNFQNEVIDSSIPVLVDFWAPWCQPCLMMSPILDELVSKSEGRFKVAKINVHDVQNRNIAMEYQIMSIPNMKLFKNGKVINEFVGFMDLATIKNLIENNLK